MTDANTITCCACGQQDSFMNSKSEKTTIRCAKQAGWIIKNDKYYCSQNCYKIENKSEEL